MFNENQWLKNFSRNVTSCTGEDGIIEKILEVIKDNDGWCVEFGAGDGREMSNAFNLIENKKYSAILIEPSDRKFRKLQMLHKDKSNIILLKKFVDVTGEDCLDNILKKTDIPTNFDVLVIDIDGNDFYVWGAVKQYKPKVVCIEFNPTIPNSVEFVQVLDLKINQGSSILSIYKLAKQKGYELISTTRANAFFVDAKYFHLFSIRDNSVSQIRSDESAVTHIFCGFDGTIFLRGSRQLYWHYIPYDECRVQQMPKFLRRFPPNYGKFKLLIAGVYFFLYRIHPLPSEAQSLLRKVLSKLFNR